MSDRRAMLEAFADALGAVTTLGLNEGMSKKDRLSLAEILQAGKGNLLITTTISPFRVVGSVHMMDKSIPPRLLFMIDGDTRTPAGGTH